MVATVFKIKQELDKLLKNKDSGIIPLSLFVFLVSLLSSCDFKPPVQRFSGSIMGTYYNISYIGDNDRLIDESQLSTGALAAMEQVNQQMSTYIENSELSLINDSKSTDWQPVSEDLLVVFKNTVVIAELTQGAFDITVAPLVNAWGFGPRKKQPTVLSDDEVKYFSAFIGADKFEIDSDKGVRKSHPGVSFDLSAIAKGYAVDKVAEYLLKNNIQHFLVDIGGELRAKGLNENNQPWQIAIEKPQITGGLQQIVSLRDSAIATSGDYRNFVEIDGHQYSHTFDPRKLKPIAHKLASASVIAESATMADALATALMVMGEKQAYDFSVENDLAVYLIIREMDGFKVRFTEQFRPYLH